MRLVYDLMPSKGPGKPRDFRVYNADKPIDPRGRGVYYYTITLEYSRAIIRPDEGRKFIAINADQLNIDERDYYREYHYGRNMTKRLTVKKPKSHIINMEYREYIDYFINVYHGLIFETINPEPVQTFNIIDSPCVGIDF